MPSFGKFSNDDRTIHLGIKNRHPNDILRTLAHEMVHYAQGQRDELDTDSGATGSPEEDQANAEAGVIMRKFNQQFPQYMELKPIMLEKWSKKYKKSINCSNPKGFSQRAHCAGRKKNESVIPAELEEACWKGYHKEGNKKMFGKTYPNCVKNTKEDIEEAGRVARKAGQPAKSKKHSDLYTDEDPKGTIHGLKFATEEDARASVSKIRNSGRSHAHKVQAAVAMEQRARAAGKASAAAVYRAYINSVKKTKESVAENFADGRNPQDKGDSKRHGIPKGATMAQLEKAAKAPGRKGQLARWQINMRRGKKK
jgi:hypothetical protein